MSKLFDLENQLILRLPEHLADQISKQLEDESNQQQLKDIQLIPILEETQAGENKLIFDFSYENFKSKATIIDLPCIVESQKSLDQINFFKSNDISQMIVVHPNNENSLEDTTNFQKKFKKRIITKKKNQKTSKFVEYIAKDGITAPTKNIRKRFFRKVPKVNTDEVKNIEIQLNDLLKEITKQKTDNDQSIIEGETGEKKIKRRYRRKA